MYDYSTVTELAGDQVTREQVERLAQRYYWAGEYCRGKEVLEVACGAGQGLGYLASLAKHLCAGDITPTLVAQASNYYGRRVDIREMDAQQLPFPDSSFDVVILFEAIYYLASAERFVDECCRVLRLGGHVLIATANKDLYDFNPSPFSNRYFGVVELNDLFSARGFSCEFFGGTLINAVSLRQKMLRPVKKAAVRFKLMPHTMAGKKFLKRLVFGKLVSMPAEITSNTAMPVPYDSIPVNKPDKKHKVILLAARYGN